MLGSEVLVFEALGSESDGAARNPTKCDVISDVKLLPTVYHSRRYPIRRRGRKLKCISI